MTLLSQDVGIGHPFDEDWGKERAMAILRRGAEGTVGEVRGQPWKAGTVSVRDSNGWKKVGTDNGSVYFCKEDSRVALVSPEMGQPIPVPETDVAKTEDLERMIGEIVRLCGYPVEIKAQKVLLRRVGGGSEGLVRTVSVEFHALHLGYPVVPILGGGSAVVEPGTGRLRVLYGLQLPQLPNNVDLRVTHEEATSLMISQVFAKGIQETEALDGPRLAIYSIDEQQRDPSEFSRIHRSQLPKGFLAYIARYRDKALWARERKEHSVWVVINATSGKVEQVAEERHPPHER